MTVDTTARAEVILEEPEEEVEVFDKEENEEEEEVFVGNTRMDMRRQKDIASMAGIRCSQL